MHSPNMASHVPSGNVTLKSACPDSGDEGPPIQYSIGEGVAIVLTLCCIMILTLMGNTLVICSVVMFRQMRTLTNSFILSLAVADMCVASLVMPFGAYNIFTNLQWGLGHVMCRIATCMDVMLTTTSILHLSCLAIDRYYAICNPFFYHQRITKRSVTLLLILCWTVPIFISWIPIMNGWNALGIEDILKCKTPPGGQSCVFLVNVPFALFGSLIAFYGPTLFMFVLNLKIYQEAKCQAMKIRSLEMTALGSTQKQEKNMKQERKAAKTLSVIMSCFCGCWCPFFIFNILDS